MPRKTGKRRSPPARRSAPPVRRRPARASRAAKAARTKLGRRGAWRAALLLVDGVLDAVRLVARCGWGLVSGLWRLLARLPRAARILVPGRATRRRAYRAFGRLPWPARVTLCIAAVMAAWVPTNWLYQVVRKPSELFFPVSGALYKTPAETWSTYAPLFRRHATPVLTPDLLAALAQVEGSGNPVVRTYWRFKMTYAPFEIYRPASSAVGMYQITDGTFAEARRLCIRDHAVAEQGAWNDLDACWFNGLYTRTIPSHAIEMTSAYLDRRVSETLARTGIGGATLREKQTLAAVVHLCGRGAALRFATQGLAPRPGERCGSHDLAAYLRKVREMQAVFARLAD